MTPFSGFHRLTNPAPLLRLLASEDLMESIWEPRDLPSLWAHQLQAKLVNELRTIDPAWALLAASACARLDPPIRTFGDLFDCKTPPPAVLDLVKRYAKFHLDPATAQLPRDIASGLYIESILAALARCRTRITQLHSGEILESARRFADQSWVDSVTRGRVNAHIGMIQEKG